tara:strand:- start:68 stop:409 length:342 start_codon:yes stop_codon:yes gene_type:complete
MFCNVGFADNRILSFDCKDIDLEGPYPSKYEFFFETSTLNITNYEGYVGKWTIDYEDENEIRAFTFLTLEGGDPKEHNVIFNKKTLISEIYGTHPSDLKYRLLFRDQCTRTSQ